MALTLVPPDVSDAPARRSRPAGAVVRGVVGLLVLAGLLAVVVVRLLADPAPPPPGSEAPVVLEPYRYV
ncbi:MAG: hypothetical protein JWN17_2592, partial [Frankiales bacterium]|nr:hypothetical protein [Frankiales bacterium]